MGESGSLNTLTPPLGFLCLIRIDINKPSHWQTLTIVISRGAASMRRVVLEGALASRLAFSLSDSFAMSPPPCLAS